MQIYQPMQTGQHLYINGQDGRFYDQNREPITAKEGLDHAMPEGPVRSHSKDLPKRSIEHHGFGLGL